MKTVKEEVDEIRFCESCQDLLAGRCLITGIKQPWFARACTNHYKPTQETYGNDNRTTHQ